MPFSPTAGDVHVDRPLTNFGQMYMQEDNDFVANRAAPMVPSDKQTNQYSVWTRADFFRNEVQPRADGAESAGGSFTLTRDTYSCGFDAVHRDVSDREVANQDDEIRLESAANRWVTQQMQIAREADFITAYMGTTIWDTDIDRDYGDPTAGNPVADFRTAKQTIQAATGKRPNKCIIPRTALDTLLEHDDITGRIGVGAGATTSQPAIADVALLEMIIGLRIFVMESVVNSAAEGATESTGFAAPNNILVYYAPDTVVSTDFEPTAMAMFTWTGMFGLTDEGFRIKRFRDEKIAANRVEGEQSYDFKVVAPELGYLMTGVSDT